MPVVKTTPEVSKTTPVNPKWTYTPPKPQPPKPPRRTAPLSDDDYTLLVRILNIQSSSTRRGVLLSEPMRDWCREYARSVGALTQRHEGNLYITKGNADLYPCFVAHLDTVHDIVPPEQYKVYYDDKGDLFAADPATWTAHGIGGDDKCGIFIAMAMLRDLPVCKVALFRDEEIGCGGARLADMDFFADCSFALEADRRGNTDVIRDSSGTKLYSDDFAKALKPIMDDWGYHNAYGSITDVKVLVQQHIGICTANIAAGYYNAHMPDTYVTPDDVGRTLAFIKDITEQLGGQRWPHIFTPPTYTPYKHTPSTYKPKVYAWDSTKVEGLRIDRDAGGEAEGDPGWWGDDYTYEQDGKGHWHRITKTRQATGPIYHQCVVCHVYHNEMLDNGEPDPVCKACMEFYKLVEPDVKPCCPTCENNMVEPDPKHNDWYCYICHEGFDAELLGKEWYAWSKDFTVRLESDGWTGAFDTEVGAYQRDDDDERDDPWGNAMSQLRDIHGSLTWGEEDGDDPPY